MTYLGSYEKEFRFIFKMKSAVSTLTVDVPLPLKFSAIEFVGRLMSAHDLPCYVEEELTEALQAFVIEETTKIHNEQSSEILKTLEGAAHDKIGNIADLWSKAYTQECVGYTPEQKTQDAPPDFTELYHKLIHSSTLGVLFNLEHTYSVAVQDVVIQRDKSIQNLQQRQTQEMEKAVQNLDITHDDQHVNMLASRHFENMQRESQQWEMELKNLQDVQRGEFRTYIHELANDTNNGEESVIRQRIRAMSDSLPIQDTPEMTEQPGMNESFTINLGAQLKTVHNLRLMSMDVLDLCRHGLSRSGGRLMPQPQRLQTAMSLYSNSLSAMVLLVDDRVNAYTGIKKEFANICQQSTDFHFPDMDTQLRVIQQAAQKANILRRQHKTDEGSADSSNSSDVSSTSNNEEISTNLQTGDFYMTRHSNLSQVHLVFHLVSDDSTRDNKLSNRHPVILALKNVLKIAVQLDIYTVTLPLLLVYEMHEEMTIQWCFKRAELVFKCVKGFMMEMATSGGSDGGETRTIQFAVPKGISEELFTTLSTLLPATFRLSRSLDLTQR